MLHIRRILCPVDFSPIATRALDHAAVLARWYGAELLALHVLPSIPLAPAVLGFPPPGAVVVEPAALQAVADELDAFVAGATPGVKRAVPLVREGPPAATILHEAAESGADLVVIGTHGRTGFERLLLGSVTEKVLRRAPCPVLTVPPRCEGQPESPVFARIVAAADFSEPSNRAAAYALSLAQEAGGSLTLLHVLEHMPDARHAPVGFDADGYTRAAARDARERLERLVPEEARDWCRADLRVACGKPYREILRVAADQGADLVVAGVRGAGAVDRMLFGSTAQHLVRQAACPVLTIGA